MRRLIFALVILIIASHSWGATYYVSNNPCSGNTGWGNGSNFNNGSKITPYLTIAYALGCMSSGDTLIIDDGTYIGSENMITRDGTQIPDGSSGAWTTVQAENDGKVFIDGEGVRTTIQIYGNTTVDGQTGIWPEHNYIVLRGVIAKRSNSICIAVGYTDHVKLINCGAVDPADGNTQGVNIAYSTYCLAEGCYAWGGGRYKIATFHSDHTVFRNCVTRYDRANAWNDPMGDYSIYSSTNIEVQNCIAIDGDAPIYWLNGNEYTGAFGCPTTTATANTGSVRFDNCIALNIDNRFGVSDNNTYAANVFWKNCVGWDLRPWGSNGAVKAFGNSTMENCTIGLIDPVTHTDVWNYNGYQNTDSISDTIFQTLIGHLFYDVETANNNDIYDITGNIVASGPTDTNRKTYSSLTNGLECLPRIESGSQLAIDGIGATILYQFGAPGTMWGETGYNLLQDGTNGQATVELWPFPNEGIIKTNMAAYSYDSGNLSGARGFCASGTRLDGVRPITLTSYIWEYLGNEIPEDIYGSTPTYDSPTITGPGDSSTQSTSIYVEGVYTIDPDLQDQSVIVTWTLGESSGFCVATLGVFSCTVPVELGQNNIVFEITDSNNGTGSDTTVVTRTVVPQASITNTSISHGVLRH